MNAIYVRQSIDKKDSLSIEGQIQQCKKLAGEDAVVFQDKGYSGKNTNRPAFSELMKAIESGKIQRIFVYRLDRFSRSIVDFSRLWEVLEQHGIDFQSVNENFDTSSPTGRAMLNIIMVFAQLERETTAERIRDNYMHRFHLGIWGGGPAPFGFDLTKILSDSRKVCSLIQNDASSVVEKMFIEYAKPETSLHGIALSFTSQNIPSPRGQAWSTATMLRILQNPIYVKADEEIYWYYLSKGIHIQQDIAAFDGLHACNLMRKRKSAKGQNSIDREQTLTVSNHLGFIDSQLWLTVQQKLSRNRQVSVANAGKYTWLTGLMKCGKCGYAIKLGYSKARGKCFLVCSGKSNLSICDCKVQVDLKELEDYVAAQISEMLNAAPITEAIPTTVELSAEVVAIEKKIERLVSVLSESSDISVAYISRQIERLHKERDELLNCPTANTAKPHQLNFYESNFEEKKLIAAEFIERVLIDGENVNIIWKV